MHMTKKAKRTGIWEGLRSEAWPVSEDQPEIQEH